MEFLENLVLRVISFASGNGVDLVSKVRQRESVLNPLKNGASQMAQ